MVIKQREVYCCDVCGWEWIPRKAEKAPVWCPNRKCRSRRWNQGGVGSGKVQREESVVRRPEESKPKETRRKGITAEEFMKLSRSEQLRARREGKF